MPEGIGPEGAGCAQYGAHSVTERLAALRPSAHDGPVWERTDPWCALLGLAQWDAEHGDDTLLAQMEKAARGTWGKS